MLKHRLIFGSVMFVALMAIIYGDDRLGRVDVTNSFAQSLLLGQSFLPAGLLIYAVFLLMVTLAARELTAMFNAKGILADRSIMMLSAALGLSAMYLSPREAPGIFSTPWAMTGLVIAFVAGMVRHVCRKQTEGALAAGGATLFAAIYLGVIPGFFLLIRGQHSAWMLAAIIMLTKACDIGAYTAGRAFGKHKLIPWLSPGKTWEGLAGGICFSVGFAMILTALSNHLGWLLVWNGPKGDFEYRFYSLPFAALMGLLLAVIGHMGDLLESLLKRDAGFKDSGATIPGFGGVLDVIDSPLLIAPVAYWLLQFAS